MAIRKIPPTFDPNDPVQTLHSLYQAIATEQIYERMRKMFPPPAFDFRAMVDTLVRITDTIADDPELKAKLMPQDIESEAVNMAGVAPTENIKPMPLRELVSDQERERRRDLVVKVGTLLWGDQWQTPLARALSEAGGRPMSQNRIAHWLHNGSQARPVPGWVLPALRAVAQERIELLTRNIEEVRGILAADEGEAAA